jgi:alanyl-tRNA synthetase
VVFDMPGFDSAMREQRERARASWKGGSKAAASPVYRELDKTAFEGYRQLASEGCEVLALVKDGAGVRELKAGEQGDIVLDHTPFYADSGGQVGDHGWLYTNGRNTLVADVHGCVMPVQGVRAHKVTARETIVVGDRVSAVVDADFRVETMRNHTGTHLVHAALREVLGTHVKQAGSLVDPKHLRFDFSHFTSVSDEEMQDIEDLANREVLRNTPVVVHEDVPIDVAVNEMGAMALFGEKYGERVRVIQIGDFSTELCGGTHTAATGEIGLLKIMGENSVSSGVRRLEAVTGRGSLAEFRRDHSLEQLVAQMTGKGSPDALRAEFERRDEEIKRLRRELEQMRMKSAATAVSSATDQAIDVDGLKVLAQRVDNVDRNQMRVLVDNLRNKLGTGVVVLGSVADGKVVLIVGVTKDATGKVQAGKVVGEIAKRVGGKGGGRPDLAEAGGTDPSQLDAALKSAPEVVRSVLQ